MSDPGVHASVGEADVRSRRKHVVEEVLERMQTADSALLACDRPDTVGDHESVIQDHEGVS